MLKVALLLGIYSYLILLLGLLNSLSFSPVAIVTGILFFLLLLQVKVKQKKLLKFDIFERLVIFLLVLLVIINFIGALGPELSFDALWYHLTIPKLYVLNNQIYFIQGNLLYYSLMPMMTEMFYVSSLIVGSEILAKLIHFTFGLLILYPTYSITREYLSKKMAIIAMLIFYSNLVVGWLSITAYVDLVRVFYESFALVFLIRFSKTNNNKFVIISAILLGFAICSKVLSLGAIPVFIILLAISSEGSTWKKARTYLIFLLVSISIPLPWFLISFIEVSNPVYPLISHPNFRIDLISLLNPITFIKSFINTFLFSADPINPFYLISIPIIVLNIRLLFKKYKLLVVYTALSYLLWYFTSQTGGSRFVTVFLPALTALCLIAVYKLNRLARIFFTAAIIFIAVISVLYRGAANIKYVPVVFGIQTKHDFLMTNLNFKFGDFYDENGEIKKIVGSNTVLLQNIHNLYYVDFPYTLLEFNDKKKYSFTLIRDYPENTLNGKSPIYINPKTGVKLFKL